MAIITYQELERAKTKGELDELIKRSVATFLDEHKPKYDELSAYASGDNPWLSQLTKRVRVGSIEVDLTPKVKIYSNFAKKIVNRVAGRLWAVPVKVKDANAASDAIQPYIDLANVLGSDFSTKALRMAGLAAVHGVCYGFYNNGSIDIFAANQYAPIPDERTGAHRAGLRVWRLAGSKQDAAYVVQLFELDGFSEWRLQENDLIPVNADGNVVGVQTKQPYRTNIPHGGAGYVEATGITAGENYPDYPVVPMYINAEHETELSRPVISKINYYDANETFYGKHTLGYNPITWIIQGYGGDVSELADLKKTAEELGIIADKVDPRESNVSMVTNEMPYLAHCEIQTHTENAIYRDAEIMNPRELTGGSLTNVAILTSMLGENIKFVGCEGEGKETVRRLIMLAGYEVSVDDIVFTHTTVVNEEEITRRIVSLINAGFPPEEFAALEPLFVQAGLIDVMRNAISNAMLGMSDADIAEYERLKAAEQYGQTNQ